MKTTEKTTTLYFYSLYTPYNKPTRILVVECEVIEKPTSYWPAKDKLFLSDCGTFGYKRMIAKADIGRIMDDTVVLLENDYEKAARLLISGKEQKNIEHEQTIEKIKGNIALERDQIKLIEEWKESQQKEHASIEAEVDLEER